MLARVWENLIQILFRDISTDFEWASRQPRQPVAKPVAHIIGQRLQDGDHDTYHGVQREVDTQSR